MPLEAAAVDVGLVEIGYCLMSVRRNDSMTTSRLLM